MEGDSLRVHAHDGLCNANILMIHVIARVFIQIRHPSDVINVCITPGTHQELLDIDVNMFGIVSVHLIQENVS